MFQPNKMYKHINSKDVAYLCYEVQEDEKFYLISGAYYNTVYNFIIDDDQFSIPKDQLDFWEEVQI